MLKLHNRAHGGQGLYITLYFLLLNKRPKPKTQKLNIELPRDPAILLLNVYLKELKPGTQRDIVYPCLHHSCSRSQKGGNKPDARHGWMDKPNGAHPSSGMYSALRKGILTQAPRRMRLEDILLSDQARPRRTNTVRSPLHEVLWVVGLMERNRRMVVTRGRGRWVGVVV